eukprot:g3652.t1
MHESLLRSTFTKAPSYREDSQSEVRDAESVVEDDGGDDDEDWREVIQRSMQTIEKMDLLFGRSSASKERPVKDTTRAKKSVEHDRGTRAIHSTSSSSNNGGDEDDVVLLETSSSHETCCHKKVSTVHAEDTNLDKVHVGDNTPQSWWNINDTSVIDDVERAGARKIATAFDVFMSAARKNKIERRAADESPNKPHAVEAVEEEEEEGEKMPQRLSTQRSSSSVSSSSSSLRGLMERVKRMSSPEASCRALDGGDVSSERLANLREKFNALSHSKVISPKSSNDNATQNCDRSSSRHSYSNVTLLGSLPKEMRFSLTEHGGLVGAGSCEVVPLELQSKATSTIIVKLRIEMRQNIPDALRMYAKNWSFSFAIQNDSDSAPPTTCRDESSEDLWWSGALATSSEAMPVCRAVELQLNPGATSRIRVCAVSSSNHQRSVPSNLCLALLHVETSRHAGNRKQDCEPTTLARRETIALSLVGSKSQIGGLLLDKKASFDTKRSLLGITLKAATKTATSPRCLCALSNTKDVLPWREGKSPSSLDLGCCDSGDWRWQTIAIESQESPCDVRVDVKLSGTSSSAGAKCKWMLRHVADEHCCGERTTGAFQATSISNSLTTVVKNATKHLFVLGVCAVNCPLKSFARRPSLHEASLIVECRAVESGNDDNFSFPVEQFRAAVSLRAKGFVHLQIPRSIANNKSKLPFRCMWGGSVNRTIPIRNRGTVVSTAQMMICNGTEARRIFRVNDVEHVVAFSVWPQKIVLAPGESFPCTVRLSAIPIGIHSTREMYEKGPAKDMKHRALLRLLIPGASYDIPLLGEVGGLPGLGFG